MTRFSSGVTLLMTAVPLSRHIVFVVTDLDPGGAERALLQIARRLHARGWKVAVCSIMPAGMLKENFEQAGIECQSLEITKPTHILRLFSLIRYLKRESPTIVQTFLFHANLLGGIAAQCAGIPIICSGIRVAEQRSRLRPMLERITNCWVSRHICVSESVARFSIDHGGLDSRKTCVIGNGVELAEFTQAIPRTLGELGLPDDSQFVVFIGRLDPQKDPGILIEIWPQIAVKHAATHLVLVGEGPLRESLVDRIQQLNLGDRIHVLGRRSDVPRILKSASLMVLPSRWEGMANVLLEAMAAQCPIVATRVEGTEELLTNGQSARLVESGDVAGMAAAIDELLTQPDLAAGLSAAAYKRISHQSWDAVTDLYEELYTTEMTRFADRNRRSSARD